MFRRALLSSITIFLLAGLAAAPLPAQWSDDPAARLPVCTADHEQYEPRMVAVGDGFVLTWQDKRRENTHVDLYAQKLDLDGEMLWTDNGRVLAEGPAAGLTQVFQINAGLLPDGSGGALFAWNDSSQSGYNQAFASRIDADETVDWGDPGVAIQSPDTAVPLMFNTTEGQNWLPPTMGIAADTEGGFFAPVWAGIGRFDAQGRQRTNWFDDTSYGFYYSGHTNPMVPVVEDDDSDGLIVIWPQGNLYFVEDIRARKLIDPETDWPDEPDTLTDEWGAVTVLDPEPLTTIQVCRIAAVPDGAGGAITAWIDNRARSETEVFYRVYAQRIDADGNLLWASDGVEVSDDLFTYSCYWWSRLYLASDGAGGVVLAWNDGGNRQWVQRLAADGSAMWTDGGLLLTQSNAGMTTHGLVRSEDGQFIVLYHDAEQEKLLAQKIDADDGGALWNDGRVVLDGCFSPYYHEAMMVPDGRSGAVLAWEACDGNLYAHRLVEEAFDDSLDAELVDVTQGEEATTAVLELRAPESGLLNLSVAAVNGDALVPGFTPGTTDPVQVDLLADNDAVATFHVVAETLGGVHDVHLAVVRNLGRTDVAELLDGEILAVESSTLTGVRPTETRAEIFNLEPGLKRLNVDVNGELFDALKRLEDAQVIERDLAPVLVNEENTVTLTSYGKAGLGAVVLIAPPR